ncbi:MAG: hypothetical protein HFJ26_01890 [Clostridia bacterium]|nr:hypothetical protein [Clostridia bacterium]
MKTKNKKMLSFICAMILILTTIAPTMGLFMSEVFASTATVTYNGKISYGGSKCGDFLVNGEQAFCMEHPKTTPGTGTEVTYSVYNDENIAKCLYYGWRGEEQWSGFTSHDMGVVVTSLALDYYYNGTTHKLANDFINFVDAQSLPRKYLTFSTSQLTAYKEGELQRTQNTTLEGDSRYSISFTLQNGVTLHNITKNTTSTGNVTVYGGDTFYLSTTLNSGITGNWISENINNCAYKYSSIVWVTQSNSIQNLAQKGSYILDPGRTINLSVNWLSLGGFTIKKQNENGDALSGVGFKIWNDTGYSITQETNQEGKIILNDLTPGTFYVQETASLEGYLLNDTIHSVNVRAGIDADGNTKVITNEEPKGSITITKTNQNGDKIQGATFNIVAAEDIKNVAQTVTYYKKGDIVTTITTSNTGIAKKADLHVGKYTIQETSAPNGYLLNEESSTVTLSYTSENVNSLSANVTVVDEEPVGTISITKTNQNGDKIEGATFKITAKENITNKAGTIVYHRKGDIVATITTSNLGVAEKTGLHLGNYIVQEVSAPNGYLLNAEAKEVTLRYANQNTKVVSESIIMDNAEPTGELEISKTDEITGNKDRIDGTSHHGDASIEGTVYTLYAKTNIHNKKGTVKYFDKDEAIGIYTFDKYGVATTKITNSKTPAKISAKGNKIIGLPMGEYYAKETIVPNGYNRDENIYNYTISYKDENTEVINKSGTVTNTVQKAPFEVIKVSTNNNTTAEVIEGAEFTAILTKYVDFYGSFDEAKKHLNEFADDEYSVFKTQSNGHGISGLLAYGEYTINETYTPSAEIQTVGEFYVNIDQNSQTPIKEYIENDLPFEAYIKLQKQDKDTGKLVIFSNATFSLYKLNEKNNEWEQVKCKVGSQYFTSWTTDKEGIAKTETALEGGKYKVDEIKVPEGFVQLDEELVFEVSNRNKTLEYDQDWDAWITVIVKNEKPTGTLNLTKQVNLKENVNTSLVRDIDFTQIAFELVANEDIIDYIDGSVIYPKDTVVGKYNLNEEGKLTVDKLHMGKYYLKEVATIDGAVLDQTKHDVIFEQTDTKTKEYVFDINVENETTFIEISKTQITGDKELQGAKLSVIDENNEIIDEWISSENAHTIEGLKVGKEYTLKEDLAPLGYVKSTDITFKVENTGEIQKVNMVDKIVEMTKKDIGGNELEGATMQVLDKDNNIVDEWISSKEPHNINNLIEGESYILHEEISIEGYVKATDQKFTVSTDKQTQKLEMIDKIVSMVKTDIEGNIIEGAEMNVTDENGEVIDSWTTTKQPHYISGLEENKKYILHELYAPEGFVMALDTEFIVSEDKQTQEITLIDKIVEMTKKDINGNELEGATMIVTNTKTKNIVDKWISSREPHKIQGLLEGESYILHEEIAIEGYVKATDIQFTVTTNKETQKLEMIDKVVLISKTDLVTGEELPGAELIVTDTEGNEIDKWISTNEPHNVTGLEEGKEYVLTEITCPYGFKQAESIKFKVSEDKQTQLVEMKDMPILKTIKVVKADSVTREIIRADFKFGIYEDEECTKLIKEVESDKENGIVSFEDLRYGIYFIKEIEAPKGYQLSSKVVKVEINNQGTFADGELLLEDDSICTFTYYNEQIPKIQTGNEMNYILLISSLIISLLAVTTGIIALKRKNAKNR